MSVTTLLHSHDELSLVRMFRFLTINEVIFISNVISNGRFEEHPDRMWNVTTKNSKRGFFKRTFIIWLDNPDEPIQQLEKGFSALQPFLPCFWLA